MSRRARQRHNKRAPMAEPPIAMVMRQVTWLSAAHLEMQRGILQRSLGEFARGVDCWANWRSLADSSNLAETLCNAGHGGGPDVAHVVEAAKRALHAVLTRHQAGGSWTLYPAELQALQTLLEVHDVQLTHCTYGDFAQAMDATQRRLAQALAGNAPANAIIVVGDLEGSHAA